MVVQPLAARLRSHSVPASPLASAPAAVRMQRGATLFRDLRDSTSMRPVVHAPVVNPAWKARFASEPTRAEKELGAPPAFISPVGRAVYVDLQTVDCTMRFDVPSKKTTCRAKVSFNQLDQGCPIIDLVHDCTNVIVDGKAVDPAQYVRVSDPIATRVLGLDLAPGPHVVELEYAIPDTKPATIVYDDKGASFFQYLSDLEPLRYSEYFQPTNLEYDTYAMKLTLQPVGATRDSRVFSNGAVAKNSDGSFTVDFPKDNNTASFYLHMVDPALIVERHATYTSIDGRVIPITTYGKTAALADGGMREVLEALPEDERELGPYAHDAFIGGMRDRNDNEWFDGSMEYDGASMGEVNAQSHELFHQYFARGVMPKDGNAAWIDEALATWHDRGYPRSDEVDTSGRYPQLSGFSPYRRETPVQAYSSGADVIADLDKCLEDVGGMKAALRDFYTLYKRTTVTTTMFEDFMAGRAQGDAKELIRRLFVAKVYGGNTTRRS